MVADRKRIAPCIAGVSDSRFKVCVDDWFLRLRFGGSALNERIVAPQDMSWNEPGPRAVELDVPWWIDSRTSMPSRLKSTKRGCRNWPLQQRNTGAFCRALGSYGASQVFPSLSSPFFVCFVFFVVNNFYVAIK